MRGIRSSTFNFASKEEEETKRTPPEEEEEEDEEEDARTPPFSAESSNDSTKSSNGGENGEILLSVQQFLIENIVSSPLFYVTFGVAGGVYLERLELRKFIMERYVILLMEIL